VLSPFDDFPIHPSADPIAHPATGDINHYDRYWFNGHQRDGAFYFGAAMGHYPVRGVIDAAFSIVRDGVEHSIFASGAMPTDRSTTIGPIRIEVVDPMRTIRYVVEPNEHGITCDLVFRATTVAVEEPRQQRRTPEGILLTDHTRLTQWGTWQGTVTVDGDEMPIDPVDVSGTRDRSWGVRPIGEQVQVIRQPMPFQVFWLWAPIHFGDRFTHLALHEHEDGRRWLETALVIDRIPDGAPAWSTAGVRECHDIRYELDWEPGRREIKRARLWFDDPDDGEVLIEVEKKFTFRHRLLAPILGSRDHPRPARDGARVDQVGRLRSHRLRLNSSPKPGNRNDGRSPRCRRRRADRYRAPPTERIDRPAGRTSSRQGVVATTFVPEPTVIDRPKLCATTHVVNYWAVTDRRGLSASLLVFGARPGRIAERPASLANITPTMRRARRAAASA
jgi:hypothetical protein